MIIPVKCFTCGHVLADKYRYFQDEVRRMKIQKGADTQKVVYLTKDNMEKTMDSSVQHSAPLQLVVIVSVIILVIQVLRSHESFNLKFIKYGLA